ncbi:MAG: AI-2E family transporter [Candidatus Marinimicrobia bacterium]|nr:AI-2E family transporter [Candidatus Neomarinimicrobiota bacterium]
MNNGNPTEKFYQFLTRIIIVVLTFVAIYLIFPYTKTFIVILIISWLLSLLFGPIVDYFESISISRTAGSIIVILFIIAATAFSLSFLIPVIIKSIEAIIGKLQGNTISIFRIKLEEFFTRYFNKPEMADEIISKVNNYSVQLLSSSLSALKNIGSLIATAVIIPFVTFFLMKDSRKFKKALISQIPNKYFELSLNVMHKIGDQVSSYLRGQAIDALLVGILSTIGLFIVNIFLNNPVPYFIFVGMLAGLANLIPYLGPVVGAIPALVIAIITNPPNLLMVLIWIVIAFILVQLIDNTIISPLVVSKSVNMHPLTVVAAVLIGSKLAGPLGMLFAVPFVGVVKVMISEISWGIKNYQSI